MKGCCCHIQNCPYKNVYLGGPRAKNLLEALLSSLAPENSEIMSPTTPDFKSPLLCKRDLRSSETLFRVNCRYELPTLQHHLQGSSSPVTDVSGNLIGPIFKCQELKND